ncbi:MAG TPA: hypothetical protein VJO53_04785 [Candidatus Acidoferrales bacterium]|nr:hypothetical protein [Candidatus Acidoferrales bacterium]
MAQISGISVLDAVNAVKARIGEQDFARIVEQLGGEAKTIFSEPIQSWKWYPLDAFVEFLETDIRETAHGDREVLITRSEKVVESQLHGIYGIVVKLGSPEFVIKRIATVHASYFQGIQIIPEIEDYPKAVIKYLGFEKHHDILEYVLIGFYRKALEICGAKQVAVKFTVPISAGAAFSELTITWA